MSQSEYLLANANQQTRHRFTGLEELCDPVSFRHLEAVGITSGWCCLEVGAGRGSLAAWLAERVGPAGRVVATDIDVSYLERPEWFPRSAARYKTMMLDALLAGRPSALVFDSIYGRDELLRFRPRAARFDLRVVRPGLRPPRRDPAPP